MISGWLLYKKEEYLKNRPFADIFLHSCKEYGLDIELRFHEELVLPLVCNGGAAPGSMVRPVFVINRTRDHVAASVLESLGCRVFNSAQAARICNDKALSYLLAMQLGLPVMGTVVCSNTKGAYYRHGLDYPVVAKDPCGHGGSGVFLAQDANELANAAAMIASDRLIIQRLSDTPGVDIRFYILGGKALRAVKRSNAHDFRSNLSQGGSIEPYEPSCDDLELLGRITDALPLDYAGIDFILHGGKLFFNELEDMVGSRALYLLGDNPALLYMQYIKKTLALLVGGN